MPTSIAIAVVEHQNQFLVGQRGANVPLAGLWEFPGGKMEPGESPEAAAVRECMEETGLVVEPLFRYPAQIEDYEHGSVELHFIACRLVIAFGPAESLPLAPTPPFCWVTRGDLGQMEFPTGNRHLLRLLLDGASSR